MDKNKAENMETHMTVIDLAKAYDSVLGNKYEKQREV